MKVIHIESGLGNQMLSYCEYLAMKYANPNDDIYIENVIFDIPECNDVICQWNGFELERIFGIKAPNIKTYFNEEQWNDILKELRESEFWLHNWNWPVAITEAFANHGLTLFNMRGDFDTPENWAKYHSSKKSLKKMISDTYIGYLLKKNYNKLYQDKLLANVDNKRNLFYKSSESILTGQYLSFSKRGNDIEKIDSLIRDTFVFPQLSEQKNIETRQYLSETNSVAIHARRGDMLGTNAYCYKYGYFKRAVKFIKEKISNPVFVFFCDPGSVQWCKENPKIFNLDFKKDTVIFIDWNKGLDSYKDMQLMSYCKHAIITNSSFGWWGAYFIENANKITISPNITINTKYHF